MRQVQLIVKRILDIILSLLCLIILSPLFLIISIMIYIKLGRPIFFVHERPGKDGKIFRMIKFRTMLDMRDEDGNLLTNEKRHTKFGPL